MTKSNAQANLSNLIRARYPLIWVQSAEETRVELAVEAIAKDKRFPKNVWCWSFTDGLVQTRVSENGKATDVDAELYEDPIAALDALRNWADVAKDESPTIFVFRDIHFVLENPKALRLFRDVARDFQTLPYTLICIASNWDVPAELEKVVTVVDWPLPDDDVLDEIIEKAENSLPDSVPCELNGNREEVIRALRGLTEFEASNVLAYSVVATGKFSLDCIPFILQEKKNIIRKSGSLEYYDTDTNPTSVGGLDLLKNYVSKRLQLFSAEASQFGASAPRGLLLVGVPGGGKSLTAKMIACQGNLPLLRLDVGSLMGSLVGQSEAAARSALKVAEAVSPCVLWVDEIEKGMSGMSGGAGDGGTSRRMFQTILTWMQEHTSAVYMVATANDIRYLSEKSPELLRRFDDIFWVDLPSVNDRRDILNIHLSKRGREQDACALSDAMGAEWDNATDSFTGAEIEKVVESAIAEAYVDDAREITSDDLMSAAQDIVPIAQTMADTLPALREWAATRARQASTMDAATVSRPVSGGRKLEV